MHPDAVINNSGRPGPVIKYMPGHHTQRDIYMSQACRARHPKIVDIIRSISALPISKITYEDDWDSFQARFRTALTTNRTTYFIAVVTRRVLKTKREDGGGNRFAIATETSGNDGARGRKESTRHYGKTMREPKSRGAWNMKRDT